MLLGTSCGGQEPTGERNGRALSPVEPGIPRLLPAAAIPAPPDAPRTAFDSTEWTPADHEGVGLSVGTASRGYLRGGLPLPVDRPGLRRRPVSVRRDAIYGTAELVGVLQRAADQVARQWPGSLLFAGDLSALRGGDIPHHKSHNSGRDADLCFFTRGPGGLIADSPDHDRLNRDGVNNDGSRLFDVPRNWALVEALVRDPQIQVQWIFVARHLEEKMISHAEKQGVDREVLKRARYVLHQPSDSLAHDDHFHVRLYCALEDRLRGCVNDWSEASEIRRHHPWVDTYEREVGVRLAQLLPFLRSNGVDEITYAIERLVWLRRTDVVPYLEPLLTHKEPRISSLASKAVRFLRDGKSVPRWNWLVHDSTGE